jgi:hypothetical protein
MGDKMSLRIEGLPIDALQDALKNPKLHSDQIENSIGRFGYVEPIVLDERTNRIVAGHGRKAALLKLKSSGGPPPAGVVVNENGDWIIPVIRGWWSKNDKEAEAYLIASNRLVELGGWDEKELASMMIGLQSEDLLSGVGYTSSEVTHLLSEIERQNSFEGMSEPILNSVWQIVIDCSDEPEQEKYLNEFISRGLKCRALIL